MSFNERRSRLSSTSAREEGEGEAEFQDVNHLNKRIQERNLLRYVKG